MVQSTPRKEILTLPLQMHTQSPGESKNTSLLCPSKQLPTHTESGSRGHEGVPSLWSPFCLPLFIFSVIWVLSQPWGSFDSTELPRSEAGAEKSGEGNPHPLGPEQGRTTDEGTLRSTLRVKHLKDNQGFLLLTVLPF